MNAMSGRMENIEELNIFSKILRGCFLVVEAPPQYFKLIRLLNH